MKNILTMAVISATMISGVAIAGGHIGNPAVKARQSHMTLYNFNAGYFGGLLRGKVEYDAEKAQIAADNLAVLASMNQSMMWVPGTDAETIEGTRAKAEIWSDFPDVVKNLTALGEATAALAAVAGNGEDAAKAAIGPVFDVCSACHKAYRVPRQ